MHFALGLIVVIPRIRIVWPAAVKSLPAALNGITALGSQILHQGHDVRDLVTHPFPISIDASAGRQQTRKQANSRRIAKGRITIGFCEGDAPIGEAVDIRSQRLRMPSQMAHPAIQIIDGDEQHIWPVFPV